jgi:site-specific recombinase XerD
MTTLRQRMLEDLHIRNYAPTTVACYIRSVAEFAQHFNKPPDQLGPEEIRTWQLFLLNEKRVRLSTYIQAICALRFFYQNTLHRRIEIDRIPLPRYEKKLPVILSKAEVKALLEAPKNLCIAGQGIVPIKLAIGEPNFRTGSSTRSPSARLSPHQAGSSAITGCPSGVDRAAA